MILFEIYLYWNIVVEFTNKRTNREKNIYTKKVKLGLHELEHCQEGGII
jgi:hypothetical protein